MDTDPLDTILEKLHKVKRSGDAYTALCPAHNDHTPSLSIKESQTDDGRATVLLKCHAGCETEAILTAIGLTKADLYEPRKSSNNNGYHKKTLVMAYDYRDENGKLLYQNVRYEPKSFSRRRPDGKGGYIWNWTGVKRVPYRLPDLLATPLDNLVYLVEGEKDADRLASYGIPASNSKDWESSYNRYFEGRNIVILVDNDAPGVEIAQKAAESLQGVAASLRLLLLPGLPDKGDVSDWLEQGNTIEALQALASEAPLYTPDQAFDVPQDTPDEEQAEPWEQPLEIATIERPVFPLDTFPKWLKEFIIAESEETQTPVDMVAMLALATVAACLARKVEVRAKAGWLEPVNLYVMAVAEPSERKSPVCKATFAPVWEYQIQQQKAIEGDIEIYESNQRLAQNALDDAERNYTKAKTEDDRMAALADRDTAVKEKAKLQPVYPPQYIASDITPESLADKMFENNERMAILNAEGGQVFSIMNGRYSDKPNFDIYLSAYTGEEITVNRKSRAKALTMKRPSITFGLAVQNTVLEELRDSAMLKRGLLARFLYTVPAPRRNRTLRSPDMPPAVRMAYDARMTKLITMPFAIDEESGEQTAHILAISKEAWNYFADWYDEQHEPKLQPDGEYGDIQEWAGKLHGNILRIAALLHVCDCLDTAQYGFDCELPLHAIERAISIANYLVPHARAALDMMHFKAEVAASAKIVKWMKANKLASFSKRDAHRALFQREREAALDEPLAYLVERGYIRQQVTKDKRGRGRPSNTYDVNPLV